MAEGQYSICHVLYTSLISKQWPKQLELSHRVEMQMIREPTKQRGVDGFKVIGVEKVETHGRLPKDCLQ